MRREERRPAAANASGMSMFRMPWIMSQNFLTATFFGVGDFIFRI